ncbi:MAG: hypothetical protein ACTSU7_06415 [Candidatus Heimdallarchaeaceae archaeon]
MKKLFTFQLFLFVFLLLAFYFSNLGICLEEQNFEGDLVIEGGEHYNISDMKYVRSGKVVVKDNSILTIANSNFILKEPNKRVKNYIVLEDNARLEIVNSNLIRIKHNGYRDHLQINLYNSSTSNISDSKTDAIKFETYDKSRLLISNSNVSWIPNFSTINSYDDSSIILKNSVFNGYMYFFDSSYLKVSNYSSSRGLGIISPYDTSKVEIENSNATLKLNLWKVDVSLNLKNTKQKNWDFNSGNITGDMSETNYSVSIKNSSINKWYIFAEDSNITIFDSDIHYLSVKGYGNISIYNSNITWGLSVQGDTSFSVYNSSLPDTGITTSKNVYINNSSFERLSLDSNCLIENSTIETVEHRGGSLQINNSYIWRYGIKGEGGFLSLINSRIDEEAFWGLVIKNDYVAHLLNSNVSSVSLEDYTKLYRDEILEILVLLNGTGVQGAKVQVNGLANITDTKVTDKLGKVRFILPRSLTELNQKTPILENYNVSIEYETCFFNSAIILDESKTIVFELDLNSTQISEPEEAINISQDFDNGNTEPSNSESNLYSYGAILGGSILVFIVYRMINPRQSKRNYHS